MHRREARDVDQRRLALLVTVFFAIGLVDAVVAVQMKSWWMTAAGAGCTSIAGLLLLLRRRAVRASAERKLS